MTLAAFTETLTIAARVKSGEWIQGGSEAFPVPSGIGTHISGLLGSLADTGLGWAVGLMGPLIGWSDDLRNDAESAFEFADSWKQSASVLQSVAVQYRRRVFDLSEMSGQTISAYRNNAAQLVHGFRIQGEAVSAVSFAIRAAATLVKNVHGTVQDAIAEVASSAVRSHARSLTSGASIGGVASPAVISQISMDVAAATARVGPMVAGAVATLAFLGALLRALIEGIKALGKWMSRQGTKAPTRGAGKPQKRTKPDTNNGVRGRKRPLQSGSRTPIAKPPRVANPKLQNILNSAYLRTGDIPLVGGNGSLVSAIKFELRTGIKVGGKDHVLKGRNTRNALRNWLRLNKAADPTDIQTAQKLLNEIEVALNGL
ncbi:hypothetical protein ACFSWE_03530 [Leucobacter albus]|uniref:Uncharacterized protein n=1 Tax=Leucobacter albus TaxID=272210 RepID=A0ABW3TNV5_9MICO